MFHVNLLALYTSALLKACSAKSLRVNDAHAVAVHNHFLSRMFRVYLALCVDNS